jgi:hypothetical protein
MCARIREALLVDDRPLGQSALVRTCKRCAREGRPELVDDPALDACPRCFSMLARNRKTRKHGMRSRPESNSDLLAEMNQRAALIVQDSGQEADAVPYTYASQTRDYVRLELLIESGFAHLAGLAAQDGRVMTTTRGYSRRIADRLVAYIGAKAKLAGQLGLERRTKDVTANSLRDFVAAESRTTDGRD